MNSTLKDVEAKIHELQASIDALLRMTGYEEWGSLDGLEDYDQIREIGTADQLQQLEEYQGVLEKLLDVHARLALLKRPIREVSRLHKNDGGRFETRGGHCYTCGSGIEFLDGMEVYDHDAGNWKVHPVWRISRVEVKDGEYYIVGYPHVGLDGLKVRVRG